LSGLLAGKNCVDIVGVGIAGVGIVAPTPHNLASSNSKV